MEGISAVICEICQGGARSLDDLVETVAGGKTFCLKQRECLTNAKVFRTAFSGQLGRKGVPLGMLKNISQKQILKQN